MGMRARLTKLFFPPAGSPLRLLILPYVVLVLLTLGLISGGAYAWSYSNSPQFCGSTCHTMPPQNAVYVRSPHANVTCEECHIGRASFLEQLPRKAQGLKETYYTIFNLYEFPIRARALRPARETCDKCHQPEAFSDDSLRHVVHFAEDTENTATTTYLIMKTGGGAKREGLGRGIHWHIVNEVEYFATDELQQEIPYVRVVNDDGSTTEYVDVESGFDPTSIQPGELRVMDCLTCHNRVTHEFPDPAESVDLALSRGVIDPEIPSIRLKAVEVLSQPYASRDGAVRAIEDLQRYYENSAYGDVEQVQAAIAAIQDIYDHTVFHDQKIDWNTYPNNLGHFDAPGCFRCHDGKHLDSNQQAIRLECNVCHSIPVVAGAADFVTSIEISRGPEPESHLNPNWISLHNQAIDTSCAACHTTEDAGGTSNTSFCSNSACHGNVFTYAGFDAPKLREILQAQLPAPAPAPTPGPAPENPTYDANVGSFLQAACAACHNATTLAGGLDLTSYAATMQGGKDGAVVIPGDPEASLLVSVQSSQHFVNLSTAELEIVRQWITTGAPAQ
jgi:hypothetical protein